MLKQINNPTSHFIGMVNKQLAVVHTIKDLDVRLRTKREQVLRLGFGCKGFFCAVPKMNVFP